MATRRMISRRVVETARFLRMPISARLLYYDLCVRADDDGIVEAFPVIQQAGCTEDDLRVLCAREFVKVLNEDLVAYIMDWLENNHLRADRKTNSIYKDLLLQVMPEAQVLDKKPRSDTAAGRKKSEMPSTDGPRTDNGRSTDGPRTDNGRSTDGPWTQNGPHRLGKVSIVKDIYTPPPYTTNLKDNKEPVVAVDEARKFYEDNIAPVCSAIELEKITDDVEKHGLEHFKRAVEIAVTNNARKLAYIEAILRRWEVNGYDDGAERGAARSAAGKRRQPGSETDWSRVESGWGPIEGLT